MGTVSGMRMHGRTSIALVGVCAGLAVWLSGSGTAVAQDKKAAAAHFARAEAADERGEWRKAIEAYELAYAEAPHEAMLYNIARDYERLSESRSAADYYRLYLDRAPDAPDRAKVERRIEKLRNQPSTLAVIVQPAGATVFIDGEQHGVSPLRVQLAAGRHHVYVTAGDQTSDVKAVTLEYGEASGLRFELSSGMATLVVACNVRGAVVKLDGELIGYTPFRGQVPAGQHTVAVERIGFRPDQRKIGLESEEEQKLNVALRPLQGEGGASGVVSSNGGEPIDGGRPTGSRPAYFLGLGYGYDLALESARVSLTVGVRLFGDHIDLSAGYLSRGESAAGALLEARVFALTGVVRPYVRGGALVFRNTADVDRPDARSTAIDGGIGLLSGGDRVNYFFEVGVTKVLDSGTALREDSELGYSVVSGVLFLARP